VEALASWPEEVGIVAIETASLPALAGDVPVNTGDSSAAGHSGGIGTAPGESAGSEMLRPRPAETTGGTMVDTSASVPTAEAEQGVPYAAETERELEPASAEAERQHTPALPDPVETVTEKPANPRRGWWQRLIQS